MSEFTCTRCGRRTFGEPALSGPKRKVCELCMRAQREKHNGAARRCAARQRAQALKDDDGKRVCSRCGENRFIGSYRQMGRGHSRCCQHCEATFGRAGSAESKHVPVFDPEFKDVSSPRKVEEGGSCDGDT
jgi:hypothetical protein